MQPSPPLFDWPGHGRGDDHWIIFFSGRFFNRPIQKVAYTIGKFQYDLYDGSGYVCALATWCTCRGVADEDKATGYSWNVFVDWSRKCRVGLEGKTIVLMNSY